jgi:hypothetical protein
MKRARVENKTAEQAAKEYFLPKYYFDPGNKDSHVPNYLKGMDPVAVLPEAIQNDPTQLINTLATPVFQLLDKETPEFAFADAVQTDSEVLGRNTWMLWSAGNDGFWDWLATDSLGFIDLLKLIDTRTRRDRFDNAGLINEPGMTSNGAPDEFGLWLDLPNDSETRMWRREYLSRTFTAIRDRLHESQRGLFDNTTTGDAKSSAPYQKMSDANAAMGTGYSTGDDARRADALKYPPPEIYGLSSGVVGLRLFPNPRFDADARKKWNADRYYRDKDYASDPDLVRPYRVGMACAFCHASFHPLNPPRDATDPGWENISGNIGAQYLRVRAVFGNLLDKSNFIYHLLDSQPPGTIDTSLIASDNINNPNAMNSVFALPQRALLSFRNPRENISPESASQPSLWRHPEEMPSPDALDTVPPHFRELFAAQGLTQEISSSNSHPLRRVPRILFDGSDSIGAWGALARVYLNIGTYYEQWIRLHRPVVGFKPQSAFTIADCEHHSVYWHATQDRVFALRDYFLKATPPMPLAAAVVGKRAADGAAKKRSDAKKAGETATAKASEDFTTQISSAIGDRVDRTKLARGRKVFANNCIVCHSSIQPESTAVTLYTSAEADKRQAYNERFARLIQAREKSRADGMRLVEFWEHDPGQWFRDKEYLEWAEEIVEQKNFWQFNFLSTDYRIPITLVQTNACRAMATNALEGSMWDDFASEGYQHMPSVGAIDFFNPYVGPQGQMGAFTPGHKVQNGVPAGGGGPGFYRVPTLVSIWSTAPLLHNNSLGTFTNDPSIDGRLRAFNDAIHKLLWPERRLESTSYNDATAERLKSDHGLIWRTTEDSYLTLSGRRVPALLSPEIAGLMQIREAYPWLKTIRPVWLPSALLLLASFFFLWAGTPEWRHKIGWLQLSAAVIVLVLWWLHLQFGWFAWLAAIQPGWLPAAILLGSGLVSLSLDSRRTLRSIAYSILAVAAVGIVVSWLDFDWKWLEELRKVGQLGWLSFLLALAALFLLAARSRWRYQVAAVLLTFAALGIVVYLHDTWFWGYRWSETVGPIWNYSLLLLAASIVLLTPNDRELSRYAGYGTLILSLSLGAGIYFFSGRIGEVRIGPIPKGTPVNLLANINPDADPRDLVQAVKVTLSTFSEIESKHLDEKTQQRLLREHVAPALVKVSKCPDLVMDHGHYFEWFKRMSDDDKESLIELLKTF